MSLIGSIKRRVLGQPEVTEVLKPTAVQEVWANPADYNRETRRRAHFRFPVSLFNPAQHDGLVVNEVRFMPRYARRHVAALTASRTRRNRRHTARIKRAIAPLQLDWKL